MSKVPKESFNIDLIPVGEPFTHYLHQDYTMDCNFDGLGYERLFLDMSLARALEFEACPFLVETFKAEDNQWKYELEWLNCRVFLSCRPVLSSAQIPETLPLAILSPYTNTFAEAVCWAAWMEVMEIDGNSTTPEDDYLFSVGLLEKGLQQMGLVEIPATSMKDAVTQLHGHLRAEFSPQQVFRPADLAEGVRFLLSKLEQSDEPGLVRKKLVGTFNLSCRLSMRNTCAQYVRERMTLQDSATLNHGALTKECLDSISHMAIYPDARVIFLKDLTYTITQKD